MDDVMRTESLTAQMGDFTTQSTQKILNIFFIVDVSGSMRFEGRIEAVNEAFTRMIPALRQIQLDSISEFELRIAIMTFDQYARWIVAPTPIMEYNHEEIVASQWVTYFSEAFKTLGEVMTSKAYMAHSGKIAEPYIMFMTDGFPTEDDIYQPALDDLKQNGWFRNSRRFAVLIGADAINSSSARDAVAGFVSDVNEGIIDAADAEAIAASVQAKTIHEVANMTKHAVDVGQTGGMSGSSSGGFSGFDSGNSGFGDSGNSGFGDDDAFDFSGFDDFDDSSFI
ncbi:MAG: vWA domain-containing protein [Lachnospiraceae bacterium]